MTTTIYGLVYSSYDGLDIVALFSTRKEAEIFKEGYTASHSYGYGIDEFLIYETADEAREDGAGK